MSLSLTRALLQARTAAMEWAAQHHPAEVEAGARHFVQGHDEVGDYLAHMAVDFAILCPPSPAAESLLERYAATRPALSSAGRRMLAALLETRLQVLVVVAVQPGTAIEAEDVLTGQRARYAERSASEQVEVGAWLLATTMRAPEGPGFEGLIVRLPQAALLPVVRAMRGALEEQGVSDPARATARQSRATGWATVAAVATARRPPNLVTADGQPVAPRTVRLRVDVAALDRALSSWPDVVEDEEGWTVLSDQAHPQLGGRLVLATLTPAQGDRVSVFVQAADRWEALRARLDAALGDGYAVLGVEAVPVESDPEGQPLIVDTARLDAAEDRSPDVEVAARINAYDRAWLDMPLPALDGQTPRQAAAAGRKAELRALLDMRRADADTGWLRQELGLL